MTQCVRAMDIWSAVHFSPKKVNAYLPVKNSDEYELMLNGWERKIKVYGSFIIIILRIILKAKITPFYHGFQTIWLDICKIKVPLIAQVLQKSSVRSDPWFLRSVEWERRVNTETVWVRICTITLFPFKKEIHSLRIIIT